MNNRTLIKTNRMLDAFKIFIELFDGQTLDADEQYAFAAMLPGTDQLAKMNQITTMSGWSVDENGYPMVEIGQDARVQKLFAKAQAHAKVEMITEEQARARLPEYVEGA